MEGMEFWGYHGCEEEERREGNEFVVDLRAEVDAKTAVESDRLEDTLDYGAVYKVIAREMEVPSNLLEHVANRILKALQKEFPQISRCSVRVSKKNPPIGGKAAWARVTLSYDREGDLNIIDSIGKFGGRIFKRFTE